MLISSRFNKKNGNKCEHNNISLKKVASIYFSTHYLYSLIRELDTRMDNIYNHT